MKTALVVLLALLVLALLLVSGALVMNRLPFQAPPGALNRLHAYLTTNVARTRPDNPFPELRPLELDRPPAQAYMLMLAAAESLGWTLAWTDAGQREFEAVARTPLLGFRDDVRVALSPTADGSRVDVFSRSRVGRGDLGANTRHVLDLFAAARTLEAGNARP